MFDLREWCKKNNLPLIYFAQRCGVHHATIFRYLKGQPVSRHVATKIANVTGVDFDEIYFTGSGPGRLRPRANGHPVKEWRIKTGTSLFNAAEQFGISKNALCAIEQRRTKRLKPSTLARIHVVTGIDVETLMAAQCDQATRL